MSDVQQQPQQTFVGEVQAGIQKIEGAVEGFFHTGSQSTDPIPQSAPQSPAAAVDPAAAPAVQAAAPAAPEPTPTISSAADGLLTRWHREMSVIGRGLSAETEQLIKETTAYLGL